MNEREALIQARENLKASMKVVRRDLKIYNKAVLNRNKAVLKNVGNDIVGLFGRINERANLARLKKQKDKLDKDQEKLQEEIRKSVELIQKQEEAEKIRLDKLAEKQQKKEEKKTERLERRLNFKQGVKQKVSSLSSKFGKVKNSILKGLSTSNIDSKLRAFFDSVELLGMKALNGVMKGANVSNFTSEQLAKYYLNRMNRQEIRSERKRESNIEKAERQEMLNEMERIKARSLDHKVGMMEAFEELEKDDIQDIIAENVQSIMEENSKDNSSTETKSGDKKLNLNPKAKQKANTRLSRLGRVNNSVLFNLRLTNIDSKLRNAFDNIQLFGINVANTTMKGLNIAKKGLNIAKDNVTNFTSEQIAKYSEWRINKQMEKERNSRVKDAEKLSNQMIAERTKDHKLGMMEAFNEQEREQYDAKHEEFLKQRQALIQSLVEEKNKLLGKQVTVEEYIEEDTKSRTR